MKNLLASIILGLLISLNACHRDPKPMTQPTTADSASLKSLTMEIAVKQVNADGVSRLPIYYQVTDRFGKRSINTDQIKLYADGILQTNNQFYITNQPDISILQAKLYGLNSPSVNVIARPVRSYPLVKLPIVLHIAKSLTLVGIESGPNSFQEHINAVNQAYRNHFPRQDPNQADSFIEFYPASSNPNGQLLKSTGLNQLDFDDLPTDDQVRAKVDSVLKQWCVKKYINVFVGIDWAKSIYPPGYSYSYRPSYQSGPYKGDLSCEELKQQNWLSKGLTPAIALDELNLSALAHELGHFLGLYHTFDGECDLKHYARQYVKDTPLHWQSSTIYFESGEPHKKTCDLIPFIAKNVMDYSSQWKWFTQDQVALMRHTLEHPYYLPYPKQESQPIDAKRSDRNDLLAAWGEMIVCPTPPGMSDKK